MNTITVLPYGTKVQLTSVDKYAFCGRDNHPKESDVGFLGLVVGNYVSFNDEDGQTLGDKVNMLGGSEVAYDPHGDFTWVCYTVRAADGRVLELMSHEIEEI